MEINEIEKLKIITRLTTSCFTTLRPSDSENRISRAEIKVYNYYELASIIRNLMKLCIVALDHDGAEIPKTIQNQSIDVGLILGIALQLFPIDEFELLNEIRELFPLENENRNNNNV
ncbi:hypothetical protein [Flavobacterium agrisoli]|uniref:Uncharacterized protein n=1 Tax=Flavobacterium agrisoli TaxID=2793066 RepID=A0A934PMY0_9FLAO|nr:hypothetical protein [Flavobacterium agrisoli]MBK0371172.1 hypothetical protein [Flavobacterium agrisoli]